MGHVEIVAEKIRKLEIQGATAIAREALLALARDLAADPRADREGAASNLIGARPNEPMLQNLLHEFLQGSTGLSGSELTDLAERRLEKLDAEEEAIRNNGTALIDDGAAVFTHCHSSSVVGILTRAREMGRNFQVFTTETRPRFQGRKTARELAKAGIPVAHAVDSAAKYALDGATIFLFGADAVFRSGFILNKVGTGIFCVVAAHYRVPTYCAVHTLKVVRGSYDQAIEERDPSEVWPDPPPGVIVRNFAFDRVNLKYVGGFITEKGILDSVL